MSGSPGPGSPRRPNTSKFGVRCSKVQPVTAKRSPSILVTDARKGQVKAPFAGNRLKQIQRNRHPDRQPSRNRTYRNPLDFMRSNKFQSKYSNITVSNLTSNISDIPSSTRRDSYRYAAAGMGYSRGLNEVRQIPQFMRALPSRSSKSIERLVLIPDEEFSENVQEDQVSGGDLFLSGEGVTQAESMTKEQRELEYPRVTSYLIAEGFNLKLTAKFLAKHHMVAPRLYDDMLYVSYSLPLLPGDDGYRVKSNNSAKNERGNELMEQFIDKSEQKEHHYEFFSGEEVENRRQTPLRQSNDFDPSEPQFFTSASPAESLIDEPREDVQRTAIDESAIDDIPLEKSGSSSKKRRLSELPDLSKHAEMFILNYGVVVFWNFSEVHEKNVLADLVFAKIDPDEFEPDEDDDDEFEGSSPTQAKDEQNSQNSQGADDDNDESDEPPSLLIKPVPEQDIEVEDFHFEYNKDVKTPRIYNDMITLKSGDHLIKLTISHAIAQSSKLSLFESRMTVILNSISRLPKMLALTGGLKNYTKKKLLMKTGRLLQLRSEVNLSSNVLDTPEYFWSIEPGLHPLYVAIREYLEIDQRVEVLNDRCKVYLDFFDVVSDTLAENRMVKISKVLIVAISLSVVVSIFEIVIRYLMIHRG